MKNMPVNWKTASSKDFSNYLLQVGLHNIMFMQSCHCYVSKTSDTFHNTFISDIEVHCVTLSFLLEDYPRLRHLLAAHIECIAHLLNKALSSSYIDVREKYDQDKLCEQLKVMVQV